MGAENWQCVDLAKTGMHLEGDVKQILPVTIRNETYLLVLINNEVPQLFQINSQTIPAL